MNPIGPPRNKWCGLRVTIWAYATLTFLGMDTLIPDVGRDDQARARFTSTKRSQSNASSRLV